MNAAVYVWATAAGVLASLAAQWTPAVGPALIATLATIDFIVNQTKR